MDTATTTADDQVARKRPTAADGFRLLSAVGRSRAQQREADTRRYAEIILSPSLEHVDELHQIAMRLGKSQEVMTADFKAVERAEQLEGLIASAKGALTRLRTAEAELADHVAETARIAAEREARRRELADAELHAGSAVRTAAGWERELDGLRAKFPDAVGQRPRVQLED